MISPVGAIINGLEVLDGEEDEEMRVVAMELIKKSASLSLGSPSVLPAGFRRRGFVRRADRHGRCGKGGEGHFRQRPHGFAVEQRSADGVEEFGEIVAQPLPYRGGAVPRGGVITVAISGEDDARRCASKPRAQTPDCPTTQPTS